MIQRARSAPRSPHPREHHPGPWLAIAGASAALRLAAVTWQRGAGWPAADPRLADAAAHLARGLGLSIGAGAGTPSAGVPPLPVLALAAARSIVPVQPEVEGWAACLLSVLAVLAFARLAAGLFGPTAGRAAAWLAALAPLGVWTAGALEPAAFAAALGIALVVGAEWLRTPRRGRALGAGLACGVCALTWTPGLGVPLVILAWAWRPLGLTLVPGERWRQCGMLAIGLACVVGPWMLRNALVLHAPIGITTSSGLALRAGDQPAVWDDPRARGGSLDVLSPTSPLAPELTGMSEPARDARARDRALAFVASRGPVAAARVAGARLLRFVAPWPPAADVRDATPAVRAARTAAAVAEAVLLLLAAWGIVRSLSGPRRWFQSLPLVAIVALALVGILGGVAARARLGAEPLLAVLAAIGFQHARRRLRLRRRGLRVIAGEARA